MKIKYDIRKGFKRKYFRTTMKSTTVILIAIVLFLGVLTGFYINQLKPLNSSQTTQLFVVNSGDSITTIANNLEKQYLIRNALVFKIYTYDDQLQAGTYSLSPSLNASQIAKIITKGKVATKLITILPGRRIDQIRTDLINSGFSPTSVNAALVIDQYKDLPVMTYVPAGVTTLEGLLWPDSYQKTADTDPASIVRNALIASNENLTSEIRSSLAAVGLTPYQGLILASIIVQEVNKPEEQAQAAQVFLSRLKIGMLLGSDVTANYGAVIGGMPASLTYDSAYNTRIRSGLPPTPISNVTTSSLNALIHPASTNWLYFVTGDNGTTYFSTNLQEHEALAAKYCHKLCGR